MLRGRRSHHEALQIASLCALQARRANAEKRTTRARRPCFQRAEASMRDARSLGRSIRETSSKASHSAALNAATDYAPKPVAVSIRPAARDQGTCVCTRASFQLAAERVLRAEGMHGKCDGGQCWQHALRSAGTMSAMLGTVPKPSGAQAMQSLCLFTPGGERDDRASYSTRRSRPLATNERPPNGSHAKLCGPSRVPKPARRAGCRD